MSTISNPLDDIWKDYLTSKDCFKMAARMVMMQEPRFARDTSFLGASVDEAVARIAASRKDTDDYFVLSLWVTFERYIVNYIRGKSEKIKEISPQKLAANFHDKLDKEIEYWRIDEMLDLLKGPLDSALIGSAKQIKSYRDWVAHRNERKPSPAKITPSTAYQVLSEIIRQLAVADAPL